MFREYTKVQDLKPGAVDPTRAERGMDEQLDSELLMDKKAFNSIFYRGRSSDMVPHSSDRESAVGAIPPSSSDSNVNLIPDSEVSD